MTSDLLLPLSLFVGFIVLSRAVRSSRESSERRSSIEDGRDNWSTQAAFTTIRLKPGDDLKASLLNLTAFYKLKAGSIVTCVGSLQRVHVRLASAGPGTTSQFLTVEDRFEIVSLVGTMESTSTALNEEQKSERERERAKEKAIKEEEKKKKKKGLSVAEQDGEDEGEEAGEEEEEDENKGAKLVPYAHLHLSVADKTGKVIGGHLMEGCIIYTTAEITIMEIGGLRHQRTSCSLSSYEELDIQRR